VIGLTQALPQSFFARPAEIVGDSTMKRIRHTPEQILRNVKTAEQFWAQGKTVADVCRALEVAQPSYH
jgi:hypothetical protein